MGQQFCEHDELTDELYMAGRVVPAGQYRRIGTNIKVLLTEDGYLPATLDGQVRQL